MGIIKKAAKLVHLSPGDEEFDEIVSDFAAITAAIDEATDATLTEQEGNLAERNINTYEQKH